jgi:hypothetical protein
MGPKLSVLEEFVAASPFTFSYLVSLQVLLTLVLIIYQGIRAASLFS